MGIILCPSCGKRMITEKILLGHMKKSHPEVSDPVIDVVQADEPVEVPEEKVVEQAPIDNSITLRFNKAVEVGINGKWYTGKEIVVDDMKTASEIVRMAKEAYGWDILA